MSKMDRLVYEFNYLKTFQDRYFAALLALLTGGAILIYAVLSGEKPILVLWLLLIIGVLIIGLILKLKKLDIEAKTIIKEMEELP